MFTGNFYDPFKTVRKHVKVKHPRPISRVGFVLRLQNKCSSFFWLITMLCLTGTPVFVHQAISCFIGSKNKEVSEDFLHDWCYLSGTYIVPEYLDKKIADDGEIPHPGIGQESHDTTRRHFVQYNLYYVVFCIQLTLILACSGIWCLAEGGRIAHLASELTTTIVTDEVLKRRLGLLTDYLTTAGPAFHIRYGWLYILCEVLNAFSLAGQVFMFDYMLHNEFLNYGTNAISYLRSGPNALPSTNPFLRTFPKVTKCLVPLYGPSGSVIKYEALCILPLHNILDKIFLFWWFWLVFVAVFTAIGFIYRVVVVFSPGARYLTLKCKMIGAKHGESNMQKLKNIIHQSSYGDWFVLSMLHNNLDSWVFSRLVAELEEKMNTTRDKRL